MTEYDYTNYFFGVIEDGLEGALDRFISVFVDPLMLRTSIDRERKAVESGKI